MGGALSAHSEGEGKGTTLEFAIPLRRVTEPGAEEETHCAVPVASADTSALLGVLPRRDDSDSLRDRAVALFGGLLTLLVRKRRNGGR
jgi:hypothetical protein